MRIAYPLAVALTLGLAVSALADEKLTTVVVKLAPGVTPVSVSQAANVPLIDWTTPAGYALYDTARDGTEALERLEHAPGVLWAEEDEVIDIPDHRSSTKGGTIAAVGDWQNVSKLNSNLLTQIRWSSAYSLLGGRRIRVAVLDTGLAPRNIGLWSRVVASRNFIAPHAPAFDWPRRVDSNGNGIHDEGTGHGSMVAGLVNLVAPRADLMIGLIADSDGNTSSWRMLKGIHWAIANGAEVINISFGTDRHLSAIECAIDDAEERQVIIVAPIGNLAKNMALNPAAIDGVVCVAGVDARDRRASFSNWNRRADVAAPATGVRSAWWNGQTAFHSGTSFASPLVAGTIALGLRQFRRTEYDHERVIEALFRSGDSIDALNPSVRNHLGRRLNIQRFREFLVSGGGEQEP